MQEAGVLEVVSPIVSQVFGGGVHSAQAIHGEAKGCQVS